MSHGWQVWLILCVVLGPRPFPCAQCGKAFPKAYLLKKHQEVHVHERRFRCGDCGKLYKTIAHVRGHRRVHSDERPFPCPQCGKRYKTKVGPWCLTQLCGPGTRCASFIPASPTALSLLSLCLSGPEVGGDSRGLLWLRPGWHGLVSTECPAGTLPDTPGGEATCVPVLQPRFPGEGVTGEACTAPHRREALQVLQVRPWFC